MKKSTVALRYSKTIQKFKHSPDKFNDVLISSLNISDADKNHLSSNGIYKLEQIIELDTNRLVSLFFDGASVLRLNRSLEELWLHTIYPNINIYDMYERLNAILDRVSLLDEKTLLGPIPFIHAKSVRLYNCLKRCNYLTLSDLVNAGAEKIYKIHNFGRKTANELCDLLEGLCDGTFEISEDKSLIQTRTNDSVFDLLSKQNDSFLNSNIDVDNSYVRLFNALKNNNINTYRDLLEYGQDGLLKLDNFGKKTLKVLSSLLMERIEMVEMSNNGGQPVIYPSKKIVDKINNKWADQDDFGRLSFEQSYRDLYSSLVDILFNADFGFKKREADVFKRRNNNTKIETLEEVSESYNITRERIRQIESKIEKNLLSYFNSPSNQIKNQSINDFYRLIEDVEIDNILSCLCYLITKKDIVSKIIKKSIVDNLNIKISHYIVDGSKKQKQFFSAGSNSEKIVNYFSEPDFYDCIDNVDGMHEISEDIINGFDSGIKASKEIEKYYYKIKIRNKDDVLIIPFPLLESMSCDLALVIDKKYVILVNIVKETHDLINYKNINKYHKFLNYCKENGFGCVMCSSFSLSFYKLTNTEVSRKKNLEILDKLDSAPINFSSVISSCRTKDDVLSAVCIQNGYAYDPKNGMIDNVDNFAETVEADDEDVVIEKIKSSHFGENAKNIFLGFLELEKNYIRPKRKNIYFSVLRVFLTGYIGSHLYEQCHSFDYFGCIPNLTPSELRKTLEWLESIELIVSGMTPHGKTYYYSNGKMISRSRILQILLNITSDINDFTSMLSDFDLDLD